MTKGVRRQDSSARRPLHKAELDEIGLDDVLDRVARLRERGGDGLNPNRPAAELDRDDIEISPVHLIEPDRVHVEQLQRPVGERARHAFCAFDHGEIAHAPEQAPAMRGVPRERRAISFAPSSESARPTTLAVRATMPCNSSVV